MKGERIVYAMDKITLDNALPQIFHDRDMSASEVWQRSLTLERGGIYLIEAASGTGKTSLCSYLIGYRDDYEGRILFDNTDIRSLSVGQWVQVRRTGLSHLFQELRLFPELTAWENIQIKNGLTHWRTARQVDEWFDAFGIAEKRNELVGRMSFGQQQRVAMIRALVQPFSFLLADEPISHLDDANSRAMAQVLLAEIRSQGAGLVVTSVGKHMDLPYSKTFRL